MIPMQHFGRTGHLSTRVIFGATAFWHATQDQADEAMELLLHYGVNHIDTAANYGDAELRLGPWMQRHRQRFFLATKTQERSYHAARQEILRSLERLQVEQLDLLQLHYLVRPEEWALAMSPRGALAAALEAREQGLVRFIGVTGHDLTVAGMHMRSLDHFNFDSVLLPYNYWTMQNPRYAAEFESLSQLCRERGVAVQTIKAMARRHWTGHEPHHHTTWYEPLVEQPDIDAAIHWGLRRPDTFLITAGNLPLLPRMLDAASRFESAATLEQLNQRLAAIEGSSLF